MSAERMKTQTMTLLSLLICFSLPFLVAKPYDRCNVQDGTTIYDEKLGRCVCDMTKCYIGADEYTCSPLSLNCITGETPNTDNTKCIPCASGYFKNVTGCDKCRRMTRCKEREEEAFPGNESADRVCVLKPEPPVSTETYNFNKTIAPSTTRNQDKTTLTTGDYIDQDVNSPAPTTQHPQDAPKFPWLYILGGIMLVMSLFVATICCLRLRQRQEAVIISANKPEIKVEKEVQIELKDVGQEDETKPFIDKEADKEKNDHNSEGDMECLNRPPDVAYHDEQETSHKTLANSPDPCEDDDGPETERKGVKEPPDPYEDKLDQSDQETFQKEVSPDFSTEDVSYDDEQETSCKLLEKSSDPCEDPPGRTVSGTAGNPPVPPNTLHVTSRLAIHDNSFSIAYPTNLPSAIPLGNTCLTSINSWRIGDLQGGAMTDQELP